MNILFLLLLILVFIFGVVPVASGTILGWVALNRIRRSEGRMDLEDWIAESPFTLKEDLSWLTTFTEWLVEDDLAVVRTAPQPEKSKSGAYVELQRTELGWRVMFFEQAEANVPLRHYLNEARQHAAMSPDALGQGN